jgi:hypothetical protein
MIIFEKRTPAQSAESKFSPGKLTTGALDLSQRDFISHKKSV